MADFAIDFGNCHSTIARLGDCFPDIIINDYDKHQTRSIVGFREDERICGELAKKEIFLNFQNTITNFKHLLGRDFTDIHAQDLSKFIPSEIRKTDDNKVAFEVKYKGETKIVRCEEVLAGLIKHLANCFTLRTNINPTRIVITCPSFFTSSQRQAIIDATEIAGFKCHKLVNENSAIARLFSLVTTDMPSTNYETVLFLNIGQTSAEVSIFKMNSEECKLKASQYSLFVGGLHFDNIICRYFARKIKERYNVDINSDKKTYLRLLSSCETIKKKISRHNYSEKIIFDNFMNIPVFEDSIDNSIFVKLAERKFKIIEDLIKKTLNDAKLEPKDIEKIVLTGGSVRIPTIKQIIERIFKKNINGTMKEDDAVSMGGSLFTTSRSHYKIQIPRMIGYRESSNLKTIIVHQQDDNLSSDGTFTKPFMLVCSDENLKVYENYETHLENKGLCEYFRLVNKGQSQKKKDYYDCMFSSDINGIISLKSYDSNNTKNNETEIDEKSKRKSVVLIEKLSGSNLKIKVYGNLESNLQNDIKQKKVKLEAKNDLEKTINTIIEWTSDYEFESNEQMLNILNNMEGVINYDEKEYSRTVDYYNELKIKLYIELYQYFQNPNIKEKYEILFRETINSLSLKTDIATKNDSSNSEKERIPDSLPSEAEVTTTNDSNNSKKEKIAHLLPSEAEIAATNDSNNSEENANTPASNQQISTCRERGEVNFDLPINRCISCNKSSGNVYSQSDHHREGRRGYEDRKIGDQSGSPLDINEYEFISNEEIKNLPSK